MENNSTSAELSASEKQKKNVQRSIAYPYFSIKDMFDFVTLLHKNYPNSRIKKDDVNEKIVENTGYVGRNLSASCQYGLLDSEYGEGYKVTDLFIRLYKPIDETERKKDLLTIFTSPKLYQTLITDYDGHAIPDGLPNILLRKYGIVEKACNRASDIFIENGKYVGAIDDKNILRVAQTKEIISSTPIIAPTTKITDENITNTGHNPPSNKNKNATLFFPNSQNNLEGETEIINLLDGKKAGLTFPSDISEKDITIIEKRLEEIKFRIKIKKEGTN